MKYKAFTAYVHLSVLFIFLFLFCLFVQLQDLRLWILSSMGFSWRDLWPSFFVFGATALVLLLSFRNLFERRQSVRNLIGVMSFLTIVFLLLFGPSLRVEDKAIERITTTLADVSYGTEGNSISFSEAQQLVDKIQALGKAELDLFRFQNEIREETIFDFFLEAALFLFLPIAVFIYGSFFLFALRRDELSQPINTWLDGSASLSERMRNVIQQTSGGRDRD
ncbi:hypothetical protein N9K67_09090 [Opitutaceae bacterium]|nr:hypothetical protein [Opitutaceae bacterium]